MTTHNLKALVQFQAAQVRSFLLEQQRLSHSLLVNTREWKQTLEQWTSRAPTTMPASFQKELQQWLVQKKRKGQLSAIGIQDEKGQWLGRVGSSLQHKVPRPGKSPGIPQILHFSSVRETVMRTGIPLLSTSGRRFWLWVDVFFSIHQRFLQERKAPAFRGLILLVDQNDRLLCGSLDVGHSHNHHHQHQHSFGRSVSLPGTGASSGKKNWGRVLTYRDRNGEKKLGIGLKLKDSGWKVWVELPVAQAYKELREWRWLTLLAAFLLLCLLSLVVLWKTRQISKPLEQLWLATEQFRQGQFEAASLPVQSPVQDEVGALSLAFGEMGKQLGYFYEHLEAEVEKRTRALHESRSFAELLFESIPDAILVTDRELKVVKANRRAFELFGESILGQFCYELLDGSTACAEDCIAHQVLATGEPISCEDQQPHPVLGEWFYRDCFPIYNDQQEVIGVLESIKLITQQKKLAAQAIHREKMAALGLLASGVAHEIGNPLASIFAVLQRLEFQAKTEDDKETYRELQERCERISRILATLSSYARKKGDNTVPLDLNAEIQKSVELIQFDRRSRNTTLHLELDSNLPPVWAPEDALSQIVTNLLINALDATEATERPEILIRTRATREGVFLQVHDNGTGVEESIRKQVFEPFFTTKPEKKGTGLGLSICRTIAEALQGQIVLVQEELGGASLELWLPSSLQEQRGESS